MSSASEPTSNSEPVSWPILNLLERRVLGVLVEKSKTTPDVYPMSVNALVSGCNQKNNRDPLLNVSEDDVEEALQSTRQKGLTIMVTGGRVVRWRQLLYEVWRVSKVELAILAELLLRGPQTEGELRGRANRMEPIDDVDSLRALLKPLAERKLVVYLTPEGRRGTTLTHGFDAPDDLERLRAIHGGLAHEETLDTPAANRPRSPVLSNSEVAIRSAEMESAIGAMHQQLAALQDTVTGLAEDVRGIKESLGLTAPSTDPQ